MTDSGSSNNRVTLAVIDTKLEALTETVKALAVLVGGRFDTLGERLDTQDNRVRQLELHEATSDERWVAHAGVHQGEAWRNGIYNAIVATVASIAGIFVKPQ